MGETLVDLPVTAESRGRSETQRPNLGTYRDLILAASYFADRARGVESGVARSGIGEFSTGPENVRHRAYVMGAVLSAAAFLEASINELYLELHAARGGRRKPEGAKLPKRVLAALGRAWADIRRSRVLPRYQAVLKVADAERFDERRSPYTDAAMLLKLRDSLLHCRPERPNNRHRYRMLEKRLRDQFAPSAFAAGDSPWFPDQCLGAGCAEWAVRVVNEFSADFSRRMSLPARGLARQTPVASELATGRTNMNDGLAPNERVAAPSPSPATGS